MADTATRPPRRERPLRWLVPLAKLLVLLLVVWGVSGTLRTALAQLADRPQPLAPDWPAWLSAAALLYAVALLPAGVFWHRLLLALGQRPPLGRALRAYYTGHLGKYFPGKALVVVIRAGLVRGPRTHVGPAAVAVFLETLTMMAVGACLSAGILIVLFPENRGLVALAIGLMLVAGLPTLPPVMRLLAGRLPARLGDTAAAAGLARIPFRLLAGGWLGIAFGWLLMALSLWATLRAAGSTQLALPAALPLLTASVALAMVAGFLSLLPGGVVVRELILVQLLGPQVGEANALVAAVLLRVTWLVSELIISGILYVSGRRETTDDSQPQQTS